MKDLDVPLDIPTMVAPHAVPGARRAQRQRPAAGSTSMDSHGRRTLPPGRASTSRQICTCELHAKTCETKAGKGSIAAARLARFLQLSKAIMHLGTVASSMMRSSTQASSIASQRPARWVNPATHPYHHRRLPPLLQCSCLCHSLRPSWAAHQQQRMCCSLEGIRPAVALSCVHGIMNIPCPIQALH